MSTHNLSFTSPQRGEVARPRAGEGSARQRQIARTKTPHPAPSPRWGEGRKVGVATVLLMSASLASAATCESLKSVALPDTTIESSATVPAGTFKDPNVAYAFPAPVPEHCRVIGVIKPSSDSNIRFEVWLPTAA